MSEAKWLGMMARPVPASPSVHVPTISVTIRVASIVAMCFVMSGRASWQWGAATVSVGAGRIGDRTPGGLDAFEDKPHRHRAFSDGGRGPFD
jgi:hypothetical protein